MLRRVPLFSDLTRRELDQLARTGRVVDHAEGHVVVTEGEKGVGFHLILDGEARVIEERPHRGQARRRASGSARSR